ncbi:glycosyltransferase family 4 protein [Candidatus Bathyarchaeota archaeon]|nr:glycosyltransferase family 4 protein [Candidatus Bathyarchaeota archaeon]
MKVVQIVNRFAPALGGAERHVYLISKGLVKRGHEVTVYTLMSLTHDDIPQLSRKPPFIVKGKYVNLPREELMDGILVKRLYALFRFWSFLVTPELPFQLFREDADIYHIHGYQPFTSIYGMLSVKLGNYRRKTVLTTHDVQIAESLPIYTHALMRFYDHSFGKLLLNLSDKIIVLNDDDLIRLRRVGVPVGKLAYVPNGVDTDFFDPNKVKDSDKQAFKEKFKLNDYVILFVGRLEQRKRVDLLLYTFKKLVKEFPNSSLLIVGPDYGELELLKLLTCKLELSDKVVFASVLDEYELRTAYAVSDVFATMSEQEAFGLTLLEAMAMRVPVCAHAWKSIKCVVKDGETGILVKYRDIEGLANAIILLFSDRKRKEYMGRRARIYVGKNFSIETVVSKTEMIYQNLAEVI